MELLEEILNPKNLNKAYKKVISNKGVAGVDGITVEEECEYLKENKDRILNQIRKRRYRPQPVKRVQIPKENGKKRNLGIPTVTDRIIQQAIVQVISPIYEEQFNDKKDNKRRKCSIINKEISKCRSNGKRNSKSNRNRDTTRRKPKSITK